MTLPILFATLVTAVSSTALILMAAFWLAARFENSQQPSER